MEGKLRGVGDGVEKAIFAKVAGRNLKITS